MHSRGSFLRIYMGGTKKKTMAAMEKTQDSDESPQASSQGSKGKKPKESKGPPQQQKRLPFLAPKMGDAEMVKALSSLKAITIFSASRALGVNSSIANVVLHGLEEKQLISKAGGFSGHYVWTVPSKAS